MNFGETLFKLRKEKGLSQEALAERLGTTRQAVSKWENDQGFPETEKLLALSNLFEVSVDTLLKGENEAPAADRERGWYVSRETARGFLAGERRCACAKSAKRWTPTPSCSSPIPARSSARGLGPTDLQNGRRAPAAFLGPGLFPLKNCIARLFVLS